MALHDTHIDDMV